MGGKSEQCNSRITFLGYISLLAICAALLSSSGIGSYLYQWYVKEVSVVLLVSIFLLLIFTTRLARGFYFKYGLLWSSLWLTLSLCGAIVFSLNFGTKLLPSILAQREIVFVLIFPVILLSIKHGVTPQNLFSAIVVVSITTVCTYLYLKFGFDLSSWYYSDDYREYSMVAYDFERGFRPKIWIGYIFLLSVFFALSAFSNYEKRLHRFYAVLLLIPLFFIISLHSSRLFTLAFCLAALFVSMYIKGGALSRMLFWGMLYCVPFIYLLVPLVSVLAPESLNQDPSFYLRMAGFQKIMSVVPEYGLFGIGVASHHSLSYTDVLGDGVYPSDYGLLGVWVKYGFFGIITYLGVSYLLVRKYAMIVRDIRSNRGKLPKLVVALFVLSVTSILTMPMIAFYLYNGIAVLAFSWGIAVLYQSRVDCAA